MPIHSLIYSLQFIFNNFFYKIVSRLETRSISFQDLVHFRQRIFNLAFSIYCLSLQSKKSKSKLLLSVKLYRLRIRVYIIYPNPLKTHSSRNKWIYWEQHYQVNTVSLTSTAAVLTDILTHSVFHALQKSDISCSLSVTVTVSCFNK